MLERFRPAAPLHFVDVNQRHDLARYPQLEGADTRGQMHVLEPSGRLTGGFDALVSLTPILPPLDLLTPLLRWEPVRRLGARLYLWLATNRYRLGGQVSCHGGACRLNP